jgi:phosphohistidine phosphatase
MKHLILMRHAEAQPEQLSRTDRDRFLTQTGMQDLENIRKKLQGRVEGLELLLCSNAKRTRQTLDGIKPVLPSVTQVAFEDKLYNATCQGLMERVRALPDDVEFVMIIAHNPGIGEFTSLVQPGAEKQPPRGFPTSSVALLDGDFACWAEASPTRFKLQSFLVP